MSDQNIVALTMPKWGLSMKEGKFINWLFEEGQSFNKGDELAEVETEKIASAVEASMSGTLRKLVAETDTVYPVGDLLAVIADPTVEDAEVNAFIEKFKSEFVPPEDDDEADSAQSEYVEVDGTRLRYVSKAQDAENSDQTLILLHGFGGDVGNWMFNQDDLVGRSSARVITIDLPGHGESSKNVLDGSLSKMAELMLGFMDQLDIQHAHFAGHSMAGAVILKMLSIDANRVDSATLISPAGLGKEINADYIDGFINGESRKQMKPVLQLLFADPELVNRQLINNILQYKRLDGVGEALQTIRAAFMEGNEQRESFSDVLKINADKIKIIWGKHDHIIPVSHAEQWQSIVDTTILDETGHMSHLEASSQVNGFISERLNA